MPKLNNQARLHIFQAQTVNVRKLESSAVQIRRSVNAAIRSGNAAAEEPHTLVLALLYCAWLEALFSKLIHTPHGFALDAIAQIKHEQRENGISNAWQKCIDLGLRMVTRTSRSSYIPNTAQRLKRYVSDFVQEPATLRNKIAHGQSSVALNRDQTEVNLEQTRGIASLDIVVVDRWWSVARQLCSIIESLIESPSRTFQRDYWPLVVKLDADLARMKTWSRASKQIALATKPVTRPGPPA